MWIGRLTRTIAFVVFGGLVIAAAFIGSAVAGTQHRASSSPASMSATVAMPAAVTAAWDRSLAALVIAPPVASGVPSLGELIGPVRPASD